LHGDHQGRREARRRSVPRAHASIGGRDLPVERGPRRAEHAAPTTEGELERREQASVVVVRQAQEEDLRRKEVRREGNEEEEMKTHLFLGSVALLATACSGTTYDSKPIANVAIPVKDTAPSQGRQREPPPESGTLRDTKFPAVAWADLTNGLKVATIEN